MADIPWLAFLPCVQAHDLPMNNLSSQSLTPPLTGSALHETDGPTQGKRVNSLLRRMYTAEFGAKAVQACWLRYELVFPAFPVILHRRPTAHQPPEPLIVDQDAVARHQRLDVRQSRAADCSGGCTLSMARLDRCQLACYVVSSSWLALLLLVQPTAHQPPEPPVVDQDAVARHQRQDVRQSRTADCSGSPATW